LRHKEEKIRRAASLARGCRHDEKTCKILRQLAENDPHHGVRMAAMESLGEPSSAADVTTFRKVAAVATGDQSKRAVELLGAKQSPTTLDALRFLVEKAYSSIVKVSAARILLRHPADAPTITKLIVNSKDWRLRAVLAEECASINILQTLANDTAESVRTAALFSIGRLKTKTAYQWLTAAYRNGQLKSLPVIMEAIALSSRVEAFDFLRDVVETNSPGRIEALRAMTVLGNAESVNFLMKKALLWKPTGDEKEGEPSSSMLYDLSTGRAEKTPVNPFHNYISQAIAAIRDRTLLPELRGWSQSPVREISVTAIRTYAQLSEISDRIWMLGLIEKADYSILEAIFDSLNGLILENPKPLLAKFPKAYRSYYNEACLGRFINGQTDSRSLLALREICAKAGHDLRRHAIFALARFSDDSDLPFLISVACDNQDDDRRIAIQSLSCFKHPKAISALREIVLGENYERFDAALAFSLVASPVEQTQLLEECVHRGKFDIAGVLDFYRNAPSWWPHD
jgi:HEAT repeat protein